MQKKLYNGMMLIELMLSLTFSLFIISILLSSYLVSEKIYHLENYLQSTQNQVQQTLNILEKNIKKAGLIGCRQLNQDFVPSPFLFYSLTSQNRLLGDDKILEVRYMSDLSLLLLEDMHNTHLLKVGKQKLFSPHDIVIISDCWHAEIFKIDKIILQGKYQILIASESLKKPFKKNAEIGALIINKFFVIPQKNKLFSLYMIDIKNKKREIMSLTDIKLRYSILEGQDLIDKTANEINDWSKVRGVSIYLTQQVLKTKKTWYNFVTIGKVN